MPLAPIVLPPPAHPAWDSAKVIALRFHTRGKGNPLIVGGVANGYAESSWQADVVGDHGESFGPWQLKARFYRYPILKAIGVDITDKSTTLAQHADAVLFALGFGANAATLDAIEAAKTGEEATRLWASGFERASAAGAVERRVAIAPQIEVWLARVLQPDP